MGKEVKKGDAVAIADAHEANLRAEQEQQYEGLKDHSRAILRAVKGWQSVRSADKWAEINVQAAEDYRTGQFLIEELGARRLLDPKQMAVLSQLRRRLVEQHDPDDAAQTMLIDLAVFSYFNALRLQGWIGNMSLVVERELFGQNPLSAVHGQVDGATIEDRLTRLGEQLLALQDRANRMMVRNLKALDDLHKGPAPTVSVGRANQLNVGHQQINSVARPRDKGRTRMRRPQLHEQ